MQFFKTFAAVAVLVAFSACKPVLPLKELLPLEIGKGDDSSPATALTAPEGYERSYSPEAHNFRHAQANTFEPVRRGEVSERFELRDGDCDRGDCNQPRSRAEIQTTDEANPAQVGKNIWYGWSFYNETVPAFTRKNSLRLVFGQWTMGGGQRPIFRFIQLGEGEGDFAECDPAVCTGPNTTQGDLVVQLEDLAQTNGWGSAENDGYVCRLFDMAEQRGKWVDLTVNTNFSAGNDGYLLIWVNGELACDYSGPLLSPESAASGRKPQHRRGIYSSWDKRWREATSGAAKPRLIVYYDEFRTGDSRYDVDVPIRLAGSEPAAN